MKEDKIIYKHAKEREREREREREEFAGGKLLVTSRK